VLFSSRIRVGIRVRIRFGCYAHVFILISIVIVTLPNTQDTFRLCRTELLNNADDPDQHAVAALALQIQGGPKK